METLLNYPLIIIFLASIVALGAASELGHSLGLRAAGGTNVATLEASVLGLLALMLSFTFAMALNHFDTRRNSVLNEATAIETATLRATLLPAPQAARSLHLLRDYVQLRMETVKRTPTLAEIEHGIARSNEILAALWEQGRSAMTKNDSMVPASLYVQALNETFDSQEKRLTAFRNRVPNIALFALYGISIAAIGFAGYASGHDRPNWRWPVYVIALLAASVMLLIQDMDRPDSGFISVSQQPIIDTANAVANHLVEFEKSAPRTEHASDDAPLRNTYWKLTNLGDTPKQTESLQGEPHLIFAAHEQHVSGSSGCNRVMGGFELNGDNLRFGRVAATKIACLNGMEQEQRFLKSLGDVAHYRISGDQLELLNGSGLILARFVAAALR